MVKKQSSKSIPAINSSSHKTSEAIEAMVQIPPQIENLQLPDPSLLNHYKNLEKRILWVDGEIDEYSLEYIKHILDWNREDTNKSLDERIPIKLFIFSGGGSLSVTNALTDVVKLSKTPVYGYNINSAFSGACYLYMVCHKKYALKKSTFLIHTGSSDNISGNYEQILAYVLEYQRQIEELSQFIIDNSKIDRELLEEKLGSEWYLTAEQAQELGIVNEIVSDINTLLL